MTATTHITYLFDPLCGWCYGASAALEKLLARPDFAIDLAPSGLFSAVNARPMDDELASFAWANDQRISRLSGQPFSELYRRDVLGNRTRLFDSGPATLALTAVAAAAPEQEFDALKAIQRARYVEGRDITDISVLSDVLRALGLPKAADRLAISDDDLIAIYRKRIEVAREEMRRVGADGVPALIAGVGNSHRLVDGNALFGEHDVLMARLNGLGLANA